MNPSISIEHPRWYINGSKLKTKAPTRGPNDTLINAQTTELYVKGLRKKAAELIGRKSRTSETLKRYSNGYGGNYFCKKVPAFICDHCTSGIYSCFGNSVRFSHPSQSWWKVYFSYRLYDIAGYIKWSILHNNFRIGFIVTLHLAIVFIIGIIDSQGEKFTENNHM